MINYSINLDTMQGIGVGETSDKVEYWIQLHVVLVLVLFFVRFKVSMWFVLLIDLWKQVNYFATAMNRFIELVIGPVIVLWLCFFE